MRTRSVAEADGARRRGVLISRVFTQYAFTATDQCITDECPTPVSRKMSIKMFHGK